MPRALREAVDWVTTYGLVAAVIAFGVLNLARESEIPPDFWKDTTAWTDPILFVLGAFVLIVGPIKTLLLARENRRLSRGRLVEETCQQLVLTVRASAKTVPMESLAAHVWRVKGDKLVRLRGFRVQPRPDSGVVWSKQKGALGQCWRENVEIEADLANVHAAAAVGQDEYEAIAPEGRFNMTWDEYRRTDKYWAVFVTPLRDEHGKVIGCVSIDCTQEGVATRFFSACRGRLIGGIIRVLEDAARDT